MFSLMINKYFNKIVKISTRVSLHYLRGNSAPIYIKNRNTHLLSKIFDIVQLISRDPVVT